MAGVVRPAAAARRRPLGSRHARASHAARRRSQRRGRELTAALLTLHALADEACAGVYDGARDPARPFEHEAWSLLQSHGSLSRLSPTRVRIVPKTHFAARGITIRSLSRYLALCYESVEVRWRSIEPPPPAGRDDYNLVLLPWPLSVAASYFRAMPSAPLANMDPERFGFFEFASGREPDAALLDGVLSEAARAAGRVDAVVLPEGALRPEAVPALERALARHGATFLIAGVVQLPAATAFGRNYLHFGGARAAAGTATSRTSTIAGASTATRSASTT